jgi:hypothetical protein
MVESRLRGLVVSGIMLVDSGGLAGRASRTDVEGLGVLRRAWLVAIGQPLIGKDTRTFAFWQERWERETAGKESYLMESLPPPQVACGLRLC